MEECLTPNIWGQQNTSKHILLLRVIGCYGQVSYKYLDSFGVILTVDLYLKKDLNHKFVLDSSEVFWSFHVIPTIGWNSARLLQWQKSGWFWSWMRYEKNIQVSKWPAKIETSSKGTGLGNPLGSCTEYVPVLPSYSKCNMYMYIYIWFQLILHIYIYVIYKYIYIYTYMN